MIKFENYKMKNCVISELYISDTGIYLYFPDFSIHNRDFKNKIYDVLADLQVLTGEKLSSFIVFTGKENIEKYFPVNNYSIEVGSNNIEECLELELSLNDTVFDAIKVEELSAIFDNSDKRIKTDIYGNVYVLKNNVYHPASDIDSEHLFKLTLFGGWFGLHNFYQKKFLSGILYVLTLGLFGIGWLLDLLLMIMGSYQDKEKLYLLPLENKKKKLLYCIIPLVFIPLSLFGYQKAFNYINQTATETVTEHIDTEKVENVYNRFKKGEFE